MRYPLRVKRSGIRRKLSNEQNRQPPPMKHKV